MYELEKNASILRVQGGTPNGWRARRAGGYSSGEIDVQLNLKFSLIPYTLLGGAPHPQTPLN